MCVFWREREREREREGGVGGRKGGGRGDFWGQCYCVPIGIDYLYWVVEFVTIVKMKEADAQIPSFIHFICQNMKSSKDFSWCSWRYTLLVYLEGTLFI